MTADGRSTITDICYVKTADGTACLLLSYTYTCFVQLLEMIGGKVRWQIDKLQMAQFFRPWSICTDGSTVFVANPGPDVLHLLSVEDGSVLTSISLRSFGIRLTSCVRVHGDHLYIGHMDQKGNTYCVSKFTKPTEV